MTTVGHHVSVPLERIVRRCLEKMPDERFRSANDLAFALQAIVEGATGADRTRAGHASLAYGAGPFEDGRRRLRSQQSRQSL